MQDHLWESCSSVVSPDDLCWSLICLHRLSGSSAFSTGREDLRCRHLMLVSCHLGDVITWWEQKLSALKIVVLSGRLRIAVLSQNSIDQSEIQGSAIKKFDYYLTGIDGLLYWYEAGSLSARCFGCTCFKNCCMEGFYDSTLVAEEP
ncbi:uncharacterized protein TNCV_529231 [Trichonephila clavipes]|nr:uncharacterized protein TNCV_529231 [Trichonephila clavipes]